MTTVEAHRMRLAAKYFQSETHAMRLYKIIKISTMLIFTNIEGKKEAVAKSMIVRFSVKSDMVFNQNTEITLIHLTNKETLRCLDKMDILIKQMSTKTKAKSVANK